MYSVTLERAEQAEQALIEQQELAALAPRLRAQRDAEAAQASRDRQLVEATQAARREVERATGSIIEWRRDFMKWAQDGLDLVRRLREIQAPLLTYLSNLVGAMRAQYGRAANVEHSEQLNRQVETQYLDVMRDIGALSLDLSPFPMRPGNNPWALAMLREMANHVGKCYNPQGGVVQFRHGGPAR